MAIQKQQMLENILMGLQQESFFHGSRAATESELRHILAMVFRAHADRLEPPKRSKNDALSTTQTIGFLRRSK